MIGKEKISAQPAANNIVARICSDSDLSRENIGFSGRMKTAKTIAQAITAPTYPPPHARPDKAPILSFFVILLSNAL